jgi:hypothetical protein
VRLPWQTQALFLIMKFSNAYICNVNMIMDAVKHSNLPPIALEDWDMFDSAAPAGLAQGLKRFPPA